MKRVLITGVLATSAIVVAAPAAQAAPLTGVAATTAQAAASPSPGSGWGPGGFAGFRRGDLPWDRYGPRVHRYVLGGRTYILPSCQYVVNGGVYVTPSCGPGQRRPVYIVSGRHYALPGGWHGRSFGSGHWYGRAGGPGHGFSRPIGPGLWDGRPGHRHGSAWDGADGRDGVRDRVTRR
ncbi:hypothetical protein [Streptosporangium sp. OZ121]|uniref:hypothetical protein n=1 Tax=Streptosporangium sp. OZ121 TaxID=3444183 RepID=UPI003F7A0B88